MKWRNLWKRLLSFALCAVMLCGIGEGLIPHTSAATLVYETVYMIQDFNTSGSGTNAALTTDKYHSGPSSLKMTATEGNKTAFWTSTLPATVDLSCGGKYTIDDLALAFWLYVDGSETSIVHLIQLCSAASWGNSVYWNRWRTQLAAKSGEWVYVVLPFEGASQNGTGFDITSLYGYRFDQQGSDRPAYTYYIDDFQIVNLNSFSYSWTPSDVALSAALSKESLELDDEFTLDCTVKNLDTAVDMTDWTMKVATNDQLIAVGEGKAEQTFSVAKGSSQTLTVPMTAIKAGTGDISVEIYDNKKNLIAKRDIPATVEDGRVWDAEDAMDAIDAIGLVSYRESVLAAIENAEVIYNALDDEGKEAVTNADVLTAARAEYDRLEGIIKDFQVVWEADTTTTSGWGTSATTFQAESTDDADTHWILQTPSGAGWSIWNNPSLDISERDFDNLTLGIRMRVEERNGTRFCFNIRTANQNALKYVTDTVLLPADNEWVDYEIAFTELQNPTGSWPLWTSDAWDISQPLTQMRFAQENAAETGKIEIARLYIYDKGIDVSEMVNAANAVVDQISGIGEITSSEQENAVKAAQDAYDALSSTQQELVVNADRLQSMMSDVRKQKSAENAMNAIASIGEVTVDNYTEKAGAIADAREAYNSYYNKYSDADRVSNLADLMAAEKSYAGFVAANQAADEIAAFEELIAAIGQVEATEESLAKIEAAEAARDALTQKYGQAVLYAVDTLEVLTLARKTYNVLTGADDQTGMTFSADKQWVMTKKMNVMPNTIEVTLRLPENTVDKAGQLIGNYIWGIDGTDINLEIYNNGQPRLYITFADGVRHEWAFSAVNVATGNWVHLTIVRDVQAKKLHCYVDGELKQTINLTSDQIQDIVPTDPLGLGSDMHYHNSDYFKGEISKIALYSDVRYPEEIKADMTAMDKEDLIAYYDLSAVPSDAKTIPDLSGNGYDVKGEIVSVNYGLWLDEGPSIRDYDYSFAIVGDQQFMTAYYPEHLDTMYDWLVDNAEAKKMQYMMNLGDITHHVSVDAEWQLAKENAQKLNGVIPYSLTRGNHDGAAKMNEYFPVEAYPDDVHGYNGMTENTWRELKVGDISYLIFTIDFEPTDEVLEWAGQVIEDHPYHNVIITTHSYLKANGTRIDSENNNGEGVWDKLVSQYENIVLVISGHVEHDDIEVTQSKGVHGNTVTEILVNPQTVDRRYWGTGTVAMFYFSDHGRQLQIEYYSTVRDQWFKTDNQKELITLDVVKSEAYLTALDEAEKMIAALGTAEEFIGSITPENEQEKRASFQNVQEAVDSLIERYGQETVAQDLSNYSIYSAIHSYLVLGNIDSIMDAIHSVSYRESVRTALEAAEAIYGTLTDEQKATVDAARAEYDRLEKVVQNLRIVWEADTSTLEGIGFDGGEMSVEDTGAHWVITPTKDAWSVWGNIDVDISAYDFNKLKFAFSVRRSGGEDSCFGFDLRNEIDQRMLKTRWYEECGATDGEWAYMEFYFNEFEDSQSGQDLWPNWTADTWDTDSPLTMFRIYQGANAPKTVEIDRVAIYYEGDIQALVDQANAVVDMIAAIGEITSSEQEKAVNDAQAAYDALTTAQQELVVNADALTVMAIAVRQHKAAENVMADIDAIGEVTADNYTEKGDAIAAAREAYDNYYSEYEDETLVTNLASLIAAEEAYNGFVEKAEDIAELEALIADIGEVAATEESLAKIEAAETAREALAEKYGEGVLEEVETLGVLTTARETYDALTAYTPGDINEDGNIDASDALLALQHSVKLTTLENDRFAAADVNKNGTVDATDALLILQYSVKLITEFPQA